MELHELSQSSQIDSDGPVLQIGQIVPQITDVVIVDVLYVNRSVLLQYCLVSFLHRKDDALYRSGAQTSLDHIIFVLLKKLHELDPFLGILILPFVEPPSLHVLQGIVRGVVSDEFVQIEENLLGYIL